MDFTDLTDAQAEIDEFLGNDAANDRNLIGLVLIARTIGIVGVEIARLLTIIAKQDVP